MKHPLETVPKNRRPAIFTALFVLTIIVMLVLNLAGDALRTDAAPAGIISYEFAGTVDRAQSILDSWSPQTKIYAGFNLGLDYLFLVAYSTTIALAVIWVASQLKTSQRFWISLAVFLAWALWGAALLDAIENYALFTMLVNGAFEPWPQVAWWSALIKFTIVIFGLVYSLIGLIAGYISRGPSKQEQT
jgi:hypothetical protein